MNASPSVLIEYYDGLTDHVRRKESMIYLDNAASSWPKPDSVIRAMEGVMRKPFGNPGRGGHKASL